MYWFNKSGDIVRFIMDIGNGREMISVNPYDLIDIPEEREHALSSLAPQLIPEEKMTKEQVMLQGQLYQGWNVDPEPEHEYYFCKDCQSKPCKCEPEMPEDYFDPEIIPEPDLQIIEVEPQPEPEFKPEYVEEEPKPVKKIRKKRTTKPRTTKAKTKKAN